jgi:hypothetical protein
MILTKQIALISERLPMRNHDSGAIEEIATRPLIRSHLCHQIRFNNSTRRSNAPTRTAEIKLKNYKSTNKDKTENLRKSIHQTNFYQCEETELPYNMQY